MANYEGAWCTNTFHPANSFEFEVWIATWPDASFRAFPDGTVTMSQSKTSDWGGLPSFTSTWNDDLEEWNESVAKTPDEFMKELADHIAPTSVCILMQSGHEGVKYIDGTAIALTGGDKPYAERILNFTLSDIYKLAKKGFGLPVTEI